MKLTAKLGEIAPAKPLKRPNIDTKTDVWHLNLDQIESNSGQILKEIIAPIADTKNSTHWFDERHVLYSKLRPYLNKVVVPDKYGVATTELVPMMPDPERLKREYLAYYLKSDRFVHWVNAQVAGAKMPRVSMKVFWNHRIPLPPLPIQQKIATILDTADALKQKDKALIAKYDELCQSLFLDMFGDPVTNPKGWELIKFADVGKLDRGKSKHRPRNAPELLGGKHPLIQTGDVANSGGYIKSYKSTYSDLGLKQSKMWKAGTLCITIAANIAKTGILTFDACFPDSVVGFIPNRKTNNEYIQYWMSFLQKILEETAPSVAQKNINLRILRDLDIPTPPFETQCLFKERLEAIEQQKQQAQASLQKSEDLFNCLLQKAFKGELVS